jgi:hypothetical protein
VLTAGAVCSRIAVAVRNPSLPDCWFQGRHRARLKIGCSELNAEIPSGIGSIPTTPELRPSYEPRKNLHAPRIRERIADHQRGRERPFVDPQGQLQKNWRQVANLAVRSGRLLAQDPNRGAHRSLRLLTARFLEMKGALEFSFGPEPGRKVAYCDTGPPVSCRPLDPRQRVEWCVKESPQLYCQSNRFARAVQCFTAAICCEWRAR